jgi:hypothetical protein
MAAGRHDDTEPVGADSGVDDGEVDRSFGKVPGGDHQGEGPGPDVLGRYVVGDVDEDRLPSSREDRPLHLRRIERPEIRQQRYDRSLWIAAHDPPVALRV